MLKVVVPDLESYRKFQSTHLTKKNGITSVKTDLPSQIIKQSFQLPLDEIWWPGQNLLALKLSVYAEDHGMQMILTRLQS